MCTYVRALSVRIMYKSVGYPYTISLMKAPNENEMKRFFFYVYVIIYCNDFQNKHFLLCDLVNFSRNYL